MPNKILVLFAHPLFEKSNAHAALVKYIPQSPNITFHDLYQEYPEFDINLKREQELLMLHDIIIWQHPIYWYSCPPLLKQWIDIVLEHGWAYGRDGKALKDKVLMQVLTTGGRRENYSPTGRDRFTVMQLLEPFIQTAKVCNMKYVPPYVIHGTHSMKPEGYDECGRNYRLVLEYLENRGLNLDELAKHAYFNDWITTKLM